MNYRYRFTLREQADGKWSVALFEHDRNIHRVTETRLTIEDAVAAASAFMLREIILKKEEAAHVNPR